MFQNKCLADLRSAVKPFYLLIAGLWFLQGKLGVQCWILKLG